ncbi:hypothetical protein [Aureimonas phyllosphaerae]|uniref:Uncharacterized protein n=1 Tax=Aureimonas phyllosphaerae TaxID=1166078 RepID=A0A7W6BX81_9HYPH|nr:hypothetical protein [Aureimonas phyllosphaerae]MBB3937719.1 hypothetical protein [Aureimonas phyllosphaerae]MBB3961746.1 hypothetical protein [Aureimonas phyllosphaerae]SFF45408.1 hypothetical protein SAMN05216566_11457 [Aureimonas phyllosphaerae]
MSEQTSPAGDEPAADWMIIEVFGHRRHAGRVREEERFGAKMLRIDIPKVERIDLPGDERPVPSVTVTSWTTHFYGGAAIFSATFTDEASVLRMNTPYVAPSRMSLPAPIGDRDEDEERPF